ncbi:subtilisin-like protease SBT5.3 [Malania oleifera]|uniref:subtilisin-like protease SBT5.3 n=1 Tax=Malania oleifera TaxID=397392 RepID=UPI0025ADC4BB|nr:subtilisin-like protease SBT5.3 [Malania oleifera]
MGDLWNEEEKRKKESSQNEDECGMKESTGLYKERRARIPVSYIVYMGSHSQALKYELVDSKQVVESHYNFLGSFLGSYERAKDAILYSYTWHINGFASMLDEEVAVEIAKHPKVVSIFPSNIRKLQTTRAWEFLGMDYYSSGIVVPSPSIWLKANYGNNSIIGNLDTGVWPESKSFSDEGMGTIPSRWKGICQNENDTTFHCNRKLIGARFFNKGYLAAAAQYNLSLDWESWDLHTPRDNLGHGSHTLSTAGGNFVEGANLYGLGNGTARGGSPRAYVASYKVCWYYWCTDADILAAFDTAIHDGVDVLSVSLGAAPTPFVNDSISIGSLHAVSAGVVVVCSAGNRGPNAGSVINVAPWMVTVGATTMDRRFPASVVLANETDIVFQGESLSEKTMPNKFFPLLSAADAKTAYASTNEAARCMGGTLDPIKVNGSIIVCLQGNIAYAEQGYHVAMAGGVGMIIANANPSNDEIIAVPHVLPTTHVNYIDGVAIFNYINLTKSPMAYISPPRTQLGTRPAPVMASFSSRGPNTIVPTILKPDVTAPGLTVLAAYAEVEGPAQMEFDNRRVPFNFLSGTSTSCPNVAGIAGLLKTRYPSWSPAAIKSAIMTSATIWDNNMEPILDVSNSKATPFDYGAGNVKPNHAIDPGLIYDLTIDDYLKFLCATNSNQHFIRLFSQSSFYVCPKSFNLLDFNYPSFVVPKLDGLITIARTVTNVGRPSTYISFVKCPSGVTINVSPLVLKFKKIGEKKTFTITIKVERGNFSMNYSFGLLTWRDGKHMVQSTIAMSAI